MLLISVINDDGITNLHLMTKEQHAHCKKVLTKYRKGHIDWPDDVNEVLSSTEITPGAAIPACKLSTGTINTAGDGGGWYEVNEDG